MKAPEKIYVTEGMIFMTNPEITLSGDNKIEYTRTDAFIEKVENFLKSYRRETSDGTGYIPGIIDDKTIEDFKRYVKEE